MFYQVCSAIYFHNKSKALSIYLAFCYTVKSSTFYIYSIMLRSGIWAAQSCDTAMFSSVRNLLHTMYGKVSHQIEIFQLLLYIVTELQQRNIFQLFNVPLNFINFLVPFLLMEPQTIKHTLLNVFFVYFCLILVSIGVGTLLHYNSVLFQNRHCIFLFPVFLVLNQMFFGQVFFCLIRCFWLVMIFVGFFLGFFTEMNPFRLLLNNDLLIV